MSMSVDVTKALGAAVAGSSTDAADVTKAIAGAAVAIRPDGVSVTKALVAAVISSERVITTPCPLPDGAQGVPYSVALANTLPGGTWSLTSGSLPAGLTLAADGTLAGIPTTPGLFYFTVKVT